ncbi:MAG: NADH-ubiquinone oxidoreductase-F iron-sulfur binding region domain-containing protein [Patescibacteria group bacterium]|nr:NADH-ubiquinone oxidoreductase-F iron-sulfur binding region domain-containing protein [Patescibacteria group bacterium]MDD4611095.1 NADH-ubiquinone oxidoreductase-F iron-sulfur binding region domain-containing protein [Patescibacteria group bacterium]
MSILNKIKKAKLVGRGGACFSTAIKWGMVKDVPGKRKFVVCNASEGEPGVKKDGYILENYPGRVIGGIKLAIDFLGAEKAYFYINHDYHKKYGNKLENAIGQLPIEFFIKPVGSGYIGGEESSLLNAIEGCRVEPRLRPPFPTTAGLFGCPTLINNVETFYNVSLVNDGEYKNKRFYTIGGESFKPGVYEFSDDETIEKILKMTKNYPDFPFFVQVGGDASGEVLNSKQLKNPASGAGLITVHNISKHQPKKLIKYWLEFFQKESCGQCTPCREGIYRLNEIINSEKIDWQLFFDVLNNLSETALCGLGMALPLPIKSYMKNVFTKLSDEKIKVENFDRKTICECFK